VQSQYGVSGVHVCGGSVRGSIRDYMALETITGEGGWMDQVLLLDGPYIKNGYIQVNDTKPGLGIELNPDVGESASGPRRNVVGVEYDVANPAIAITAPRERSMRWSVVGFLTVAVIIAYIDRISLSSALPEIRKTCRCRPELSGMVLSAFFWSYAALQTPAGWVIDRYGVNGRMRSRSFCGRGVGSDGAGEHDQRADSDAEYCWGSANR